MFFQSVVKGMNLASPPNWTIAAGYVLAAEYCLLLHMCLRNREVRLGYDAPGMRHRLSGVPIRYWSMLYLFLGVVCFFAPT